MSATLSRFAEELTGALRPRFSRATLALSQGSCTLLTNRAHLMLRVPRFSFCRGCSANCQTARSSDIVGECAGEIERMALRFHGHLLLGRSPCASEGLTLRIAYVVGSDTLASFSESQRLFAIESFVAPKINKALARYGLNLPVRDYHFITERFAFSGPSCLCGLTVRTGDRIYQP